MDIDIELSCPECGALVACTARQIADGATVACEQGHPSALVDESGTARRMSDAMDALTAARSQLDDSA